MTKKALTVGINYPGQPISLRGCVNDSKTIENLLRTRYGFEDITVLLDNQATTERMKRELRNLIEGARPGDVLFFHFSGHGTQIIDDSDPDHEPDGLDEVICPVDFNWQTNVIKDDDLKHIFSGVPYGVNLTVFLDCCNSGGGTDAVNEYKVPEGARNVPTAGSRYLPPPSHIRRKIEASGLTPQFRSLTQVGGKTSGILISGAQAHQTAADAYIEGRYQGATTHFLNKTINELGVDATHKEIIERLNQFMVSGGFSQRPQLDGPEDLYDRSFLSAYEFGNPNETTIVPPVLHEEDDEITIFEPSAPNGPTTNVTIDNSTTVVNSKPDEQKDSNKKEKRNTWLIVGAVALVVAVAAAVGITS